MLKLKACICADKMAQYLCSPVNLVKDVSEASPPTWTNLILFEMSSGLQGKEGSWLSLLLRLIVMCSEKLGPLGFTPCFWRKVFIALSNMVLIPFKKKRVVDQIDTADVNFSELSQGGRWPMIGESLLLTVKEKKG